MATRRSGRARVVVTWNDLRSHYNARVAVGGRTVWKGTIGAPRSMHTAVDSPASFDSAAHAALSFALDEGALDEGDLDFEASGTGYSMSRNNPCGAKKNPSARASKPKAFRAGLAEGSRKRSTAAARAYAQGLAQGLKEAKKKGRAGAKRNPSGQAAWDAAFVAGFKAGAKAYASDPFADYSTGQRVYARSPKVRQVFGIDWLEGFGSAIDAARGMYATPGVLRAKSLGL